MIIIDQFIEKFKLQNKRIFDAIMEIADRCKLLQQNLLRKYLKKEKICKNRFIIN